MGRLAPLLAGLCVALAPAGEAEACRGPFPPPITLREAVETSDAVFVGTVASVTDGLPADYVPPPGVDLAARAKEALRQGKRPVGRTLTFTVEEQWRGARSAQLTLVELTPINTCEWERDVAVGDRVLVFAVTRGNALGFPSGGFDPRGAFIRREPRATDTRKDIRQGMAEDFKKTRAAVRKLRAR